MSLHTVSVLVEDRPGVLTQVSSLFARRGFNIHSLSVGTSEVAGISRMTVVVRTDEGGAARTYIEDARAVQVAGGGAELKS